MTPLEYSKMCSKLDDFSAANEDKSEPKPISPWKVILKSGNEITPQPITWLWKHWLAQGKFHILAGSPGIGKTTMALACMATVSQGGYWPDGSPCEQGNVLIWSGEDDPADTLLPRLIASGVNRDRVFFVEGTQLKEGVIRPFDVSKDLPQLEEAVNLIGGVSLIVVDPVVSAVTGDSHKNTETRAGLQPLVDLAAKLNAAILGITHLSKGSIGQDPVNRVIGSIAFTAVARCVLVAAKKVDADGTSKRVLMRAKANNGPDEGGFEYHLEQSEPIPGIVASYCRWGVSIEGTAREVFAEPDGNQDDDDDHNDAVSMLRDELKTDCWTPAKVASKALSDDGLSKKQIRTAKKKLGVISKKGGMETGWYWRLPSKNGESFVDDGPEGALFSPEGAEGATLNKQGILGTFNAKRAPSDDADIEDIEPKMQCGEVF